MILSNRFVITIAHSAWQTMYRHWRCDRGRRQLGRNGTGGEGVERKMDGVEAGGGNDPGITDAMTSMASRLKSRTAAAHSLVLLHYDNVLVT